ICNTFFALHNMTCCDVLLLLSESATGIFSGAMVHPGNPSASDDAQPLCKGGTCLTYRFLMTDRGLFRGLQVQAANGCRTLGARAQVSGRSGSLLAEDTEIPGVENGVYQRERERG